MQTFKEKKVAILGLSVEGADCVNFFVKQGAKILCCDRRTPQELGDVYTYLKTLPLSFQLGSGYLQNLESYDVIVRTPGMNPRLPELAALRSKGKHITSLTKLFFDLCDSPIIGVTGTKGKGTTSTLIYEMVKAAGMRAYLGGNVGTPLLSKVGEIKKDDIVVLELSSFQLEDLTRSPHIAVVLRVTEEHLANYDPLATNVHESREAYREAKKPIVRFQTSSDISILNADDPTSITFAGETKASVYYFSAHDGRCDAFVKEHAVYLATGGKTELICKGSEIKLRGLHNLENIAAASLAAALVGVPVSSIQQIAKTFKGLPHRLESLRMVKGVLYVNDSFSTVPETAIAAIRTYEAPIILILGGSEKGSDFTQLGKAVAASWVKAVIVVGMMTQRIVSALKKGDFSKKIITGCGSMHEIVARAASEAKPGDIVLLSPACASFDMFKNYKERGELFRYEVSHL